jgi:hypothetical protein
LQRSTTAQQLKKNIDAMLDDYPYYVEQAQKFAKYHLEYQQDSIEYIATCLVSIAKNKENFPIVKIHEKVDKLKLSIINCES